MDSKALYPHFHAEVHRYKSTARLSKSTSHLPQPTTRTPGAAGSRPSSSCAPRELATGLSRPGSSSASSPQNHFTSSIGSNRSATRDHSGDASPVATARRRMLPPCLPASANQYVVAIEEARNQRARQAFTRQKSFCRIQDVNDPSDDDRNGGGGGASMNNDDALELFGADDGVEIVQTQRSVCSRKPPSRQIAIRGELDLLPSTSLDSVESSAASTTAAQGRQDSFSSLSHIPTARVGTPSTAMRRGSSTIVSPPLLLSSSSESDLHELVYVRCELSLASTP